MKSGGERGGPPGRTSGSLSPAAKHGKCGRPGARGSGWRGCGPDPAWRGAHSATPSPEDVRSWAQSFDKLMHSPAGRSVFREFLRTEYSEENMLFWLACEELKAEADQHVVDEKARLIYEDYVSILSPKEVHRRGDPGQGWGLGPRPGP